MLSRTRGLLLPSRFLFGASSCAHQTEGGNTNSDWWQLEHRSGATHRPSGDAADSYHRWPVDMDLLAELGFTDYRFSIEWARIEPAPGHFSRAALAHYRRMVEGALERGLRPLVTLQHFTLPRWFADQGGWTAEAAADRFARYVAATAPIIGSDVQHVCTINEPDTVAALSTDEGTEDLTDKATDKVADTLIRAHRQAVAAIKEISPDVQVGWSVTGRNEAFLRAAREDDWIGVQVCTALPIGPDGPPPPPALNGWDYQRTALGQALRRTAEVVGELPMIVTENGVATADDTHRIEHTARALQDLAAALADGVDIRGYFHWSALDSHAWSTHRPAHGLIAVDPETFIRAPRPSARWLGRIAADRVLPLPCVGA
ncbi:family 1 glycosylhydrolase [Kitasatospora azatica]|uniref:family 1 glycosylhydrolase n=1 Tax=Kitasatospora azatica TaxID=58347 RepID=UPI00068BC13E|nr:family 1 glycosylhydrolase [Kitasatospora azatica]